MDGPVTGLSSTPPSDLEPLFADRRLWRGHRVAEATSGIASGHAPLDAALPDGGFPAAALTEIFVPSNEPLGGLPPGLGEIALVLPALARLSQGPRLIVFVAPPEVPYAPALVAAGIDLERLVVVRPREGRDAAWAAEQALRDGSASAVLAWIDHALITTLRRLQLAAEAGDCLGLLYRPWAARRSASPAALRLALTPAVSGLRLDVLKCRGTSLRSRLELPLTDSFAP